MTTPSATCPSFVFSGVPKPQSGADFQKIAAEATLIAKNQNCVYDVSTVKCAPESNGTNWLCTISKVSPAPMVIPFNYLPPIPVSPSSTPSENTCS
jgi:hypothetical protein